MVCVGLFQLLYVALALRDTARLLLRSQIGVVPGKPLEVSKDEIWGELVNEVKKQVHPVSSLELRTYKPPQMAHYPGNMGVSVHF